MSNYDVTLDTIGGKTTGEPLISLWRHYPGIDMDINSLVDTTYKDYLKYPSDVVKLSPHGRYCCVDFGCKIEVGVTDDRATGSSSCKTCPVKSPKDWKSLEKVDPLDGHFGEQIKYVEKISKLITKSPIMMTVFSPTMVARKISKNGMPDHLKTEYQQDVNDALQMISDITIEFARACLDAGADGIFAAVQEADQTVIEENEVSKLLKYNKKFIDAINKKAKFTVLHIHGENVYFQESITSLPTTAVNWHDQTADIGLQDASKLFTGGLFGGLEPDEIFSEVKKEKLLKLRDLTEDIPFILAPGCVLLQGTPEKHLELIFKYYKS